MVDNSEETRSGPQEIVGRRTDEWSECLTLIAANQDRAAFTRFFRHFAPLIKAFALAGSSLSASVADELVQEVMLKVWQKAGGFNPEKAAASTWVYTIARNCRTDMFRRLQKFDTPLAEEDVFPEQESEEPFALLQGRRIQERVRDLMADPPGGPDADPRQGLYGRKITRGSRRGARPAPGHGQVPGQAGYPETSNSDRSLKLWLNFTQSLTS